MKRRAIIIEDNVEEAQHLVAALKEIGIASDHVEDGSLGFRLACERNYDLAIVDNMLPGMQGREIVAGLRSLGSRIPIIILSALGTESHFIQGLRNGADDYLRKPCSFGELQARVEALLRRSSYAPPSADDKLLACGDIVIDLRVRRASRNGRVLSLTPMEYNLLEYLMRNRGRLVPAAAIVAQVWGFDAGTSQNLVATRLSELRRKIVAEGELDPIVTKRGFGYGLL